METVLYVLIFQGCLGGFDVMWNHERKENLPHQLTAHLEQKIHGVRELLYSIIFVGLAWFAWQGIWAGMLFGLLIIEILLTAWDFVVEDQTRTLSPNERVIHLVLSMGGGAYTALLLPELWHWSQLPTALVSVEYGVQSWILTLLGVGVLGWSVRDYWSGVQLTRKPYASDEALTVYFDASCALCKREMAVIRLQDVAQRLSWVDCSAADFDDAPFRAESVTRADMMASLHLRTADGAWVKGVDAFALLHRTVGMTGLAMLWGGKWTRPITQRLYPLVAQHRQLLSWTGLPLVFVVWEKCAARRALRRSQACRAGACSL